MVKFYYDLLSPPSRALLTFFKMARIPIEEKPVALRKQEHKTEEYRRNINEFGLVPLIHDGDFRLTESVAILRYMTKKYPVDDFWYPKDLKARARVDEYLSWTHNNIRMKIGMAWFTKFRDPLITGKAANPEVVQKLDKELQKGLNEFEDLWTGNVFITGDQLTFADVLASCDLEQARLAGVDPWKDRPKMTAWFNRTRAQLEPLFTEHHKYLYVFEGVIKKMNK